MWQLFLQYKFHLYKYFVYSLNSRKEVAVPKPRPKLRPEIYENFEIYVYYL